MEFLDRVKAMIRPSGPDKPIDITQGIRQAMDRGAVPMSRERTVAPNRFQVILTPQTEQSFTQWGREALISEFIRDAQIYAKEQNYNLLGSVQVELISGDENTRRSTVVAQAVAGAQPLSSEAAPASFHEDANAEAPAASAPAVRESAPAPAPHAPLSSDIPEAPPSGTSGTITPGTNLGAAVPAQPAQPAQPSQPAQLPQPEWKSPLQESQTQRELQENRHKPLLEVVEGQTYLLVGQRTVVGRGKNVDIALEDTGVSHQHFEIKQLGEHYVLHDLGSTNGTFVEGHRVQEATLLDRNIITAGRVKMIFWRQAANPSADASYSDAQEYPSE